MSSNYEVETLHSLQQCTICFITEADIEFTNCGDQVCFSCLEQFTLKTFKINIKPVEIECPICDCPVDLEDWEPFVDEQLLEEYQRAVMRDRRVRKDCQWCGALGQTYKRATGQSVMQGDLTQWFSVLNTTPNRQLNIGLIEKHGYLMHRLYKSSRNAFYRAQLLSLELIPQIICTECSRVICLRCGLNEAHDVCEQEQGMYKRCPRCFTMIEKEGDGCNEMKCEVCGMVFCWECLRKWSRDCGIYNCPLQQTPRIGNSNTEAQTQGTGDKLSWELLDKIKKNY